MEETSMQQRIIVGLEVTVALSENVCYQLYKPACKKRIKCEELEKQAGDQ
jgi:hypothetical protein